MLACPGSACCGVALSTRWGAGGRRSYRRTAEAGDVSMATKWLLPADEAMACTASGVTSPSYTTSPA